ncbi:MAG: TonB-dependent receptor [Bacteroidales bacterium]|nr:TonB-dependent receptor [Bacteroidales bacterium]
MNRLIFKRLILLVAGVLIGGFVLAQEMTVTGTVTDAADGLPIPGVNVLLKGTFAGTSTDVEGKYELKASEGDVITFSFLGYHQKEVTLGSNNVVNVSLEQDVYSIAEVVTIGYGTIRKEDATGSVSAISSADFNKGSITSPQELISGKIAGVQITNGGGAPGEGAVIRIRGGSSLSATNDPLIVIDGVPIDNGGVSGMRNPLNTIHPNDIESFTVLKDASATAIYGSRASNGVILIQTKKGKLGKAIKVNYNANFSIGIKTKGVEVYSGDEYRDLINEKFESNPLAIALLGSYDTDWQSEIYRTAVGHDHNLSFSGGVMDVPYRVSLGYSDQNGILKTDRLKRFTGTINVNPSFLDDHLKVNVNVKGMRVKNNFANRGAVGAAVAMDPTKPVNVQGNLFGQYFTWLQTVGNNEPITIATMNPVAQLNMRDDQSTVYRIIGNVQADYKFHFLPELKLNVNMGLDRSYGAGKILVSKYAPWSYDSLNGGGEDRTYDQGKTNELLDIYLNYKKDIESIDSRIDATAGYSWQHFYYDSWHIATNYDGTILESTSDDKSENYLVSFFGRMNYILKDRYMVTGTVRQDGSSRFSPDTRWGIFPAVALAWDASKESFINSALFSTLKLRLGWGVTGQQDIGGNYPYLPAYTLGMNNAMYQFGDLFYNTYRPEGYAADIKWEETTTYNVGFDFGFLSNRITGSVEAYQRVTEDLLNYIPVPAGTNLTNYITTNIGSLENKGIEFSIDGKIISTTDMVWDLAFNATYNENKITKLTLTDDEDYIGVPTGGISGGVGNNIQIHSVGYPANSFYVFEQVYNDVGMPVEGLYVDRNEDGIVNDEDKYRLHKAAPDVFMGISSSFIYKDFDFGFSGRANIGNFVYNNNNSGVTYSTLYNSVGYLNNINTTITETGFNNPKYFSDHYVQNASFFRLDNISAGYNLSKLVPTISSLRVFASVQNVFVLTKYTGLDPEVSGGIDNNIYPRPMNIMFGVSAEF